MAPIKQQTTGFKGKHFNNDFAHGGPSHNAKRKRKWIPDNKFFTGGVKEGQGFALKRKEKIKHEYSKLLRRERWTTKQSNIQWEEEYPEHLKHLYLAEKKRLEEREQENRNKRIKGRAVASEGEEKQTIAVESSSGNNESSTTLDINADQSNSSKEAEITITPQAEMCGESSQNSNTAPFIQRKKKNVSSYQKTKQEYERMKEERERKREEYLKNKAQREEALKKYKEKKMATYQLLRKKTKKGQPNLNLQMELILQKIQAQQK